MIPHSSNDFLRRARGKAERVIGTAVRGVTRAVIVRRLQTETRPCLLCGGVSFDLVHERDKSDLPVPTARCGKCGFVMENPAPTPAFLKTFYSSLMYRGIMSGWLWPNKHYFRKVRGSIERNVDYVLELRDKSILTPASPKVLDIGCAEGTFLALLKERWPDVELTGVEPGANYAKAARKSIEIHPTMDALPDGARYTLITMWHVFEHVQDPDQMLASIKGRLSENGILALEVPDVEKYGDSKRMISLGHLYHYSRSSLLRLMHRNGFAQIDVSDEHLQLPDFDMKLTFKASTRPASPQA